MLMMRRSHDLKRYSLRLHIWLPTTSSLYRHRREDDHHAFSPRLVQGKLYIHVNTNQMKAIPSPSIHKVDLEPQSVHIRSLTTNFEIFCAHRLLFKTQPRK